jgi:DNA sulfur modification protein DndE
MRELRVKRIRFCREADTWLKVLKTRTGVTPNILCRLGFCLSLEEPSVPQVERYPEDSQREINRYTLLGEYDLLFASLLRQRLAGDGVDLKHLDEQFRAHMNRGVILLVKRLRSLQDLGHIIEADVRSVG